MGFRIHPLTTAVAIAFSSAAFAQTVPTLNDVVVSASRPQPLPEANALDNGLLPARRAATSDTASLLLGIPGVNLNGAGGVSSLPAIRGLADDRLRIQVDGMDLISACGNHMNPPLSYLDPTAVGNIQVFAGITPVSVGGDSIGGTIIVDSRAPLFAKPGEGVIASGELGAFYRSNGDAHGANVSATLASENLSIRYNGSTAQSDNYKAAREFKPGTQTVGTKDGSHWIAGDEVASSAYKSENHALGVAWKLDNHLLDLRLGYQNIPYQGFPNQHMDMTGNESSRANLAYTGKFVWGQLEARVYHERTRHEMNFAEDKRYWYSKPYTPCSPAGPSCVQGMPMETEGKNTGARIKAEILASERDLFRVGADYQRYRLNDWWAPSGGMMMWPLAFENIDDGKRDRLGFFGEWEARWSPRWTSLLGARSETVDMDTGEVHGYNTGMMYATDAKKFNARDRARTDHNLDLTALLRFAADASQTYEGGYARKTRSPSLYERYTWSTNGMAMTMNNWVNDGNGYVGNLDLKPEVAHTLSFSADWHDAAGAVWGIRLTPYYTLVDDYIDAQCAPGKTCKSGQFNYLTLANQDARLYGFDLSGHAALGQLDGIGSFTLRGVLGYVRGKNRTTGDNLYNIMPLNARLALEHRLGNWSNTLEEVLVSGKDEVSQARYEMPTKGYGLLNLRSSVEWKHLRLDVGVENLFNQVYAHPLGGAYIGQGTTMSLNGAGAPYGVTVPGMGRSFYAEINLKF